MAQFIGYLKGSRGEASRIGHKASGLDARAQGWDIGGRASMTHYASVGANGADIVSLWVTRGSNGAGESVYVGSWRIGENGQPEPCTSLGTTIQPERAQSPVKP